MKIINNDDKINSDKFDDQISDTDMTRVDVNGDKLENDVSSHCDIKTSNNDKRSKEEGENDHTPKDNTIKNNTKNIVMEKENIAPNKEIYDLAKVDNKKRDRNTSKPHSNDKKNSKISSYFSIKSVDFINNTKLVQPHIISSIDKSLNLKIEDEMIDTANFVCLNIDTTLELKINTEKENTSCSNKESASSSSSSSPNVEHTVETPPSKAKAERRHDKLWLATEAERMRNYRAARKAMETENTDRSNKESEDLIPPAIQVDHSIEVLDDSIGNPAPKRRRSLRQGSLNTVNYSEIDQ